MILGVILLAGVLSFFFTIYLFIIPIAIMLFSVYLMLSVPSIAVILSAFGDILMPLAVIDLLGMKLSSAGVIAFLMLIGYSVDTDILLTTRILKRKGESVNRAIFGAFKTGITMTLTSIVAVVIAFFITYRYGTILNEIFIILLFGLGFDIINTWVSNASIIKWYVEGTQHRHEQELTQ